MDGIPALCLSAEEGFDVAADQQRAIVISDAQPQTLIFCPLS